jgi:putative flippase GtrA
MPHAPRASGATAIAKQFVSFALAGIVGLAVDAGVFVLLTGALLWSIALARAVSMSGAIATTWILNRTITFAAQRSPRRGAEFLRYVSVQAAGLVVNGGLFALLLWLVPSFRQTPLVPLFLGCTAGFAFNFAVMRALVFRA